MGNERFGGHKWELPFVVEYRRCRSLVSALRCNPVNMSINSICTSTCPPFSLSLVS